MQITPAQFGIIAFLAGVFFADIFRDYSVIAGSFVFFGIYFLVSQKKLVTIIWSVFGFISGAVFLFFSIENIPPPSDLQQKANREETAIISGIIISFPEQKEDKTSFELLVLSEHKEEKILVSQYGIHKWSYGDSVEIKGTLKTPKPFSGFAYDRFLAKDNIFVIVPNAKVEQRKNAFPLSSWQIFWKKMFLFRESFEWQIRNTLEFPESEYALGIVLGSESGIPKEILEEFNISGLRHLLALSGFNITILISIIFFLFGFLRPFWRILVSLMIIGLFVGITGGSASVIRAAVMGGVGMVALHAGRSQHILWVAFCSLFLITLWNPFLLASDPSLQLSVLAVFGLILYQPIVKKHLSKYLSFFPIIIQEVFLASLAAQIFTLPYMAYAFATISPLSIFANIFVVPITSFAMLLAFLCAIPWIGLLFMPFAYIVLHFSLSIAHVFAHVPIAQLSVPNFSAWHLFWLYGILVLTSMQKKS